MRYESEILYDLMKRDGLLNPSQDNLPYESELKEKYVDEVKGAYPKVTDYRPEWLNYNIGHYIPADFPTETLVNVTSGTVNNVVPYAYKSAILKGQTLVNLSTVSTLTSTVNNISVYDLKDKCKYLFKCDVSNPNGCQLNINFNFTDGTSGYDDVFVEPTFTKGSILKIFNFDFVDKIIKNFNLYIANNDGITLTNIQLIEYQEGMEKWDIPYFEGMQSVKMPVLTTSNEDGTKTNILSVNEPVELRGVGDVRDTLDCLTGEVTERISEIVLDGSTDEFWELQSINSYGIANFRTSVNAKDFSDLNCDKLPMSSEGIANTSTENIMMTQNKALYIRKKATVASTVNELRQFLASNPITVQYKLKTESIKTVDLTSVNQDGVPSTFRPFEGTMHIQTDGTTLKPLFSGEIPVEATTQNLASFVNLEGVERTVNEYVDEEIVGDENNEQLL